MARKTREQLGITSSEYKEYKGVRTARNKLNKQLAQDYKSTLNLDYREHVFAKTGRERKTGKRLSIGDFKSRQNFEKFMEGGKRYTDPELYRAMKARDYKYNMRQALVNMGATDVQLERYDDIVDKLDNYGDLDSIYSSSEELDLSYVYVETREQGIERIDSTLNVLEKLVNEKIKLVNAKIKSGE